MASHSASSNSCKFTKFLFHGLRLSSSTSISISSVNGWPLQQDCPGSTFRPPQKNSRLVELGSRGWLQTLWYGLTQSNLSWLLNWLYHQWHFDKKVRNFLPKIWSSPLLTCSQSHVQGQFQCHISVRVLSSPKVLNDRDWCLDILQYLSCIIIPSNVIMLMPNIAWRFNTSRDTTIKHATVTKVLVI